MEVSKPILMHLQKFYSYLRDVKGLKELTCEKNTGNIELFIVSCLGLTKIKELKEIDEVKVDYYLSKWFMNKVATSKNSIKEQIAAITHYIKFLEITGEIGADRAKAMKSSIKNKDKYYNIFESLFDSMF